MRSYVQDASDAVKTYVERKRLASALKDRTSGQRSFDFIEKPENPEQYGLSPNFRRQLKARVMQHDLPVQIARESTLDITDQVRRGLKGVNPLSDRLWNLGTAMY